MLSAAPSLVWRAHLPLAPHGLAGGAGSARENETVPTLIRA